MKYSLIIIQLLIAALAPAADRFVFDMPDFHNQHLKLLALMNEAHSKGDYYAMGAACYRGINLQTSGNLWTYNLACALALQNNPEEALQALATAIELGFHDLDHINSDPDLNSLRDLDAFKRMISRLTENLAAPDYTNSVLRRVIALPPEPDNTILQSATNTIWSFSTAKFHTFVALSRTNSPNETKLSENKPAPFMVYANRDNGTSSIDISTAPGVLKLAYSQDVKDRKLHIGAPNTLLMEEHSGLLVPVVGNSSLGFIDSAYWRCQPRAVFNDPELIHSQALMLLANQIYCYPTYSDFRLSSGDLFPANTPYYIAVSGGTGAEKPFVSALIEAVCALPAETREHLVARGALMPTMQALLRRTLHGVGSRQDYMSGKAHPAALLPEQLDTARFVQAARTLTTNSIPPLALIQVEDVTGLDPALDMPASIYSEHLFATHLAVSKIFRALPYKRRYKITVLCQDKAAGCSGVLLQGDPAKVRIERSRDDSRIWLAEVAHHQPFNTPVADGKRIETSRVDIGFFAFREDALSIPAILSVYFPCNERRVYDDQERLVSIDYRRFTAPYTDPLLSFTREWKDLFKHDPQGRITGWIRTRPRRNREVFTSYGDLAVEFDDKGRATKARRIKYIKRYIGNPENNDALPTLAQVDDNIEVRYSYASDDDFIGKPDAVMTRLLAPPDTDQNEDE